MVASQKHIFSLLFFAIAAYGQQFTDSRDGKKYKTVAIGKQTWMAENLNYNANGSKCYNDSTTYCDKYGRLYDWNTAKSACPKGWHLSTNEEWEVLTVAAGGEKIARKYLNATSGWNNNDGEDKFGFSALPGGYGHPRGYFFGVGGSGYWWSAPENDSDIAYIRFIVYSIELVLYSGDDKHHLFSVRCLKDY